MTKEQRAEIDQLTQQYREDYTPDVSLGLDRLRAAMQETPVQEAVVVRTLPNRRRWLGIAASVAVLLTAGLLVWPLVFPGGSVYATADEPRSFTLPDGSEVLLNQNSKLQIAADYGVSERGISLEGEGYFTIKPDADLPFMVRQRTVSLRVVGTTFNLRTTPDQEFFEVEVATGKVLLNAGAKSIPVAAKECGRYHREHGLTKMPAPHLNRHAWRTRKLIFRDTPFSEALELVERSYNITIVVDQKLLEKCDFTFSGDYTNESLTTVLESLEKLSGASIELQTGDGSTYLLTDWCAAG